MTSRFWSRPEATPDYRGGVMKTPRMGYRRQVPGSVPRLALSLHCDGATGPDGVMQDNRAECTVQLCAVRKHAGMVLVCLC